MLRFLFLALALAAFGLGLLTIFKAPDWLAWKCSVLAGEFGGWTVPGALALGGVAYLTRGRHESLAWTAVALSVVAALLLAKPSLQAWRIGRSLPEQLNSAFGRFAPERPAFSVLALFRAGPSPVKFETLTYSEGLELDFYRAQGRAHAPVVVIVHGGGWDNGERHQIPQFNDWLADHGYAVADISYRLAPKYPWPAQRDDIRSAVEFVRAHAEALGIDPERIVLFGRSAGGQLAEATAYGTPLPGLRGVAAFYAPADMNFAYKYGREDDAIKSPELLRRFLGGPPAAAQANYDSASAIQFVNSSTPPTFLVHGELDSLVWHRQSERLDRALAEAGVHHHFLSLPWATHAIEYNLNGPSGQLTTYALEWFLSSVTR